MSLIKFLLDIKHFFTFSFFLLTTSVGYSQNTAIPDPNFEQVLIDLGLDSGPINGLVPTANINGVVNLDINNKNISDLTGIEDFAALSILNCDGNSLTRLNITKNTNLTQLFCRVNQLTNLDVSKNINLNILWVTDNQLTGLDVSKNIDLISLITSNNPLNSLDVTNNTKLNVFYCERNQLTNLDVTQNALLAYFNVDYNALTSLNISKNTELTYLACGDNLITSLDLTKNTKLLSLFCARIPISNLNVTKNILLETLVFGDNQISLIDVSKNTKLIVLWCARNFITHLDVSKNVLLESFVCDINNLSSLDLSNNKKLRKFSCDDNNLCYVNIKNGNNINLAKYSSTNNPNLSCIFVDNIVYSTSHWTNIDATSDFVTTQAECDAFGNATPPVDTLNDFIGTSYTLPSLNNGNYFTEPYGHGISLNAGDIIATSQTIYIFNDTDCYNNESSFNVEISDDDYYIPKFFTPNNDGSHDYWRVIDKTNAINSINIYNRYGKLLKSLPPNSEGWNGSYRGRLLGNDDYWYAMTLNSGEIVTGHFALKR